MKYHAIKELETKKVGELSHQVGLFWAFSTEQFHKNKTPLAEGEKYVSIGSGGFVPKSKAPQFIQGMEDIANWKKAEVKKLREQEGEAERVILAELNNFETFYSGEIDDAVEVLEAIGFTREQVLKVYRKYQTQEQEVKKYNEHLLTKKA